MRHVDLAAFQHLLRDEIPGNGLCMVTQIKQVAASTVKRPKFDILFGENIFFLQNLFR
jgi:hypothetical protein